jgi:hypothetical protein
LGGRSLLYNRKSGGPSIKPWGILRMLNFTLVRINIFMST